MLSKSFETGLFKTLLFKLSGSNWVDLKMQSVEYKHQENLIKNIVFFVLRLIVKVGIADDMEVVLASDAVVN